MNQLFIPKKIRIGFQNRTDCFTNKLAYIIYYDNKGILRKEKSWNGWIDKDIEAEEYENTPQSGFCLNKDVKRYNWGHFSSKRTLIRVHDERGWEFEIPTDNLLFILMNDDCSKRGLMGDYVYAWWGTELILLPCSSEEYKKAQEYTGLQSKKISAKELKPGFVYKTKKEENITYLGRFDWYSWSERSYTKRGNLLGKKYHIFTYDEGKTFETKSDIGFLAEQVSQDQVANYAALIEKFQKNIHSSKIVKFQIKNNGMDFRRESDDYYANRLKKQVYFKLINDELIEYHISGKTEYSHEERKYKLVGYFLTEYLRLDVNTQQFIEKENKDKNMWGYQQTMQIYQQGYLESMELGDLSVTLENGKTIKVDTLYNL